MSTWQSTVDDWFGTHQGVASVATLTRLGMSEATVHRWIREGRLIRTLPGVVRSRQFPDGLEQQYASICARNPAALIGFTSAATSWSFRKTRSNGVHALVPHGVSPELPGIIVHRCRRIDPVDIVERDDGIRLTSPPRTLFDAADMLGFDVARSVLEQLLHEERCTYGTMVDTVIRLAHPNRPGTRTMLEVIASRPKWRRALQSDLEMRVLAEIERQALPVPVTQCPVALPSGAVIHLDFGWPEWSVGLEVDDPAWHAGVEERHRDARRDRQAATVGWVVPRVSKIDVEGHLREAIDDVAAIIGRRQHP